MNARCFPLLTLVTLTLAAGNPAHADSNRKAYGLGNLLANAPQVAREIGTDRGAVDASALMTPSFAEYHRAKEVRTSPVAASPELRPVPPKPETKNEEARVDQEMREMREAVFKQLEASRKKQAPVEEKTEVVPTPAPERVVATAQDRLLVAALSQSRKPAAAPMSSDPRFVAAAHASHSKRLAPAPRVPDTDYLRHRESAPAAGHSVGYTTFDSNY
jgi:hypothetical protein